MKIGSWKTKTGKERKSGSKSLSGSLLERTSMSKKVSFLQGDISRNIFGRNCTFIWVIIFYLYDLENIS